MVAVSVEGQLEPGLNGCGKYSKEGLELKFVKMLLALSTDTDMGFARINTSHGSSQLETGIYGSERECHSSPCSLW